MRGEEVEDTYYIISSPEDLDMEGEPSGSAGKGK